MPCGHFLAAMFFGCIQLKYILNNANNVCSVPLEMEGDAQWNAILDFFKAVKAFMQITLFKSCDFQLIYIYMD